MRHNAETAGGFVTTTTTPARLASLEGDVAVPVLQAIAVGLAVGLALLVGVLLLGGPVAGLEGRALWAWAGRVGGVGAVLSLAGAVLLFVAQHRRALWSRETRQGEDLDGDAGEPETVRIELYDANKQQTRWIDLPVSDRKLREVARAVLWRRRNFSRPALCNEAGILSQTEYHKLAAAMIKRGLLIELPGNQRELTAVGRSILRHFMES